ncbi:Integrase catalytic core [Macrophomina phaseolina MS6]|uniref:Integrase catalytic core n=1 Tax=Macrophomina phaseolina (strain MS6) TaxID=1126212 RepID=K2RXS3_MACPH|nr:Integrase catalytic core [Macrophomina phaseolina MS6]
MRLVQRSYVYYSTETNGRLGLYRRPIKHFGHRKVLKKTEIFNAITQSHCDTAHGGIETTWKDVQARYWGVTRNDVKEALKVCRNCVRRRHQSVARAPLRPIVVHDVFEKVQIDLIDYCNRPDPVTGDRYVLHMRDYFTDYTMLVPLPEKSAACVAAGVLRWICSFGPMRSVQNDRGGGFLDVVKKIFQDYGIRIDVGRPHHPQAQGRIEQANGQAKSAIEAAKVEYGHPGFAYACVDAAIALNNRLSRTRRCTPCFALFGRGMWVNKVARVAAGHRNDVDGPQLRDDEEAPAPEAAVEDSPPDDGRPSVQAATAEGQDNADIIEGLDLIEEQASRATASDTECMPALPDNPELTDVLERTKYQLDGWEVPPPVGDAFWEPVLPRQAPFDDALEGCSGGEQSSLVDYASASSGKCKARADVPGPSQPPERPPNAMHQHHDIADGPKGLRRF